jgi:hypothetical protein
MLMLADAADQPVAVRDQPVDSRLEVVDLEGHVAQPQLVGHRGGWSGLVVGPAGAIAVSLALRSRAGQALGVAVTPWAAL